MHEIKVSRNRMGVIKNFYQGKHKKILTVCSAGCLRSPTAAHILASEPFNFNTRCCGTSVEYAIVPLNAGLVIWADEIVCMDEFQAHEINQLQQRIISEYEQMYEYEMKKVHVLDIEDNYGYRDSELVKTMLEKFYKIFQEDLKIPND